MELKWLGAEENEERKAVLIAPLWNWNMYYAYPSEDGVYVLIAPLWNWNPGGGEEDGAETLF